MLHSCLISLPVTHVSHKLISVTSVGQNKDVLSLSSDRISEHARMVFNLCCRKSSIRNQAPTEGGTSCIVHEKFPTVKENPLVIEPH